MDGSAYHVQDRKNVQQKSVKMSCDSTKFPSLMFCGPHKKPYGLRGLSKHYYLQLDHKSGNGKCEIIRTPCL